MILYQIKLGYIILLGEKAELCCLFIKLYLLCQSTCFVLIPGMAVPDGWTVKANLGLSVNEMELLRKNLPAGKTVNEWINEQIRKDISELEKKD